MRTTIINALNNKKIKYILGITILCLGFIACQSKTNKRDYKPVLAAIVNYQVSNNLPINSGSSQSVLDIKQTGLTVYNGYCQDTFTAFDGSATVTANNYFQATGGPSFPNSGLEKKATSNSTCSSLGFTGGFKQTDANQMFSYKIYFCSPSTSPCNTTAIKAAGFTGPFQ